VREKNLYCNFLKLNLIKKHGIWEKGKGGNGREFFDGVVICLLIYFKVETKVR
jgi:hypothetical protein